MKARKIIGIIILVLSLFMFVSCKTNEENVEEEKVKEHEVNTDFSYIYDAGDFTYDVSKLIVSSTEISLPDLTGMNRAQIKYILDQLDIKYEFKFDYTHIEDSNDYNKFVGYSEPYTIGSVVKNETFFYVYTTLLDLTYSIVDEVKIDFEYIGKSFLNDGVGLVTLVKNTDGDTATFKDMVTGENFRLRFLCIDTPESTIDHDPWGKAASNFTASYLSNAKEIVLSREDSKIKETYGRYLGYVWVDGVLLNLLLVTEAYTNAAAADSKYKNYFVEAMLHAQVTGRRFYGEIDPNYDYEAGDFK